MQAFSAAAMDSIVVEQDDQQEITNTVENVPRSTHSKTKMAAAASSRNAPPQPQQDTSAAVNRLGHKTRNLADQLCGKPVAAFSGTRSGSMLSDVW